MKRSSENTLDTIESLFYNLKQNFNQNQSVKLKYKLNDCWKKEIEGKKVNIIETKLIDGQYFQTAFFVEKAYFILKECIYEQFMNVNSMIIQLVKWKVVQCESNKDYKIMIYDFEYITSQDGEHECVQYNVMQNLTSKKPPLRQKNNTTKKDNNKDINDTNFDTQTNNQQIQQSSNKKVKIENSFNFNEHLQNNSELDNPANQQQSNQYKIYQQQQQEQQELTKRSTMYQNMTDWVLEGRIILKSEQLEQRDRRKETITRYFRILILDCEQEMIVGLFYEKALSKFYAVLQQGKVYTFKNACIDQDKINGTKKIIFNEYSIILESQNFAIPSAPQLTFSTLKEIESMQPNSIVDVVAVVQEIKQDTDVCKSFIVVDQTTRLCVKLWGAQYANISLQKGEIMVFKGLKFLNENFKSLSSDYQTMIIQNRDLNEVKQLKMWLIGKNIDTIMQQNTDNSPINLQQLKDFVQKTLNEGRTQTYHKYIIGQITIIQYDIYPCCPEERCKSKMEEIPIRKTYRCKKCPAEQNQPKLTSVLTVKIKDYYTDIEALIYDEIAVKLHGKTADQLQQMTDNERKIFLLSKEFQQKKMKLQIQFQNQQGFKQPKFKILEIQAIFVL